MSATKKGKPVLKRATKRAANRAANRAPTPAVAEKSGPRPTCLRGHVVQEDGSVLRDQYVYIADGKIQSVGRVRPKGVRKIDYTLKEDELIFPSFLDLHTHSSYNMLPLWHSPYWAWDNRFQWRANADYKQTIGGVNAGIRARYGHGTAIYKAFNAFSELMAIAGGTTVLQENAHVESNGFPEDSHFLVRNTGSPSDMDLAPNEVIVSVTDLFEPDPYTAPRDPSQDTAKWKVKPVTKGSYDAGSFLDDFSISVTGTRTRGTIVHLAEGRSGYLQTKQRVDPYTRAEFEAFKAYITRRYDTPELIELVRNSRLMIIHGCGMNTISDAGIAAARAKPAPKPDPNGAPNGAAAGEKWSDAHSTAPHSTVAETIEFLRTYGITIIWSPVSNLLLYQDTTNVLPLLDAGVPVVLGTDWTPSGSKTVWEEAKFAAAFLEARGWQGDALATCFRSVTSLAADALGLPLGRVRAGNFADVVIVRRPAGAKRGSALQTFKKAGDADVRGVFVGGVPLYGDADVLKAFGAKPYPLPEEHAPAKPGAPRSVASTKSFALPQGCPVTVEQLTEAIAAADAVVGRDRPKFLVADDPTYQSRIAELSEWVQDFDAATSPNPKPTKAAPSGLAPGELEWMYNPSLDPQKRRPLPVVELLGRMAPCRDIACEVPKRHPFYHSEVLTAAGNSYGMRTPCMPVVPVLTAQRQIFAMGDYPTAKFTARSTNNLPVITGDAKAIDAANAVLDKLLDGAAAQAHGHDQILQTYIEEIADIVRGAHARPDINPVPPRHGHAPARPPYTPSRKNAFFVPVADVFSPMQDANYFDGYKVRDVAAGVFFQERFLSAVGVDIDKQVWLTNMIKCFLFHESMAASYQALGWTDVKVEQSYSELLPVAKVCSQWIDEEVVVADPQLVLTVGKPPCTLLHGLPLTDVGLQGRVYNALLGVQLPAHDHRLERAIAKAFHQKSIDRVGPWGDYNVFHMLHPQAVMMSQTSAASALLSAITYVLGPKASKMSLEELQAALLKYLGKHTVADLIKALPFGARDQFYTSAKMLEIHAVSLANLADVLRGLSGFDKSVTGETVLAAQAHELATAYHLADSPDAELARLTTLRAEQKKRIAGYLRGRK
jgi:cytosine/adenosine deaminase-related metal-dependent hydrolase